MLRFITLLSLTLAMGVPLVADADDDRRKSKQPAQPEESLQAAESDPSRWAVQLFGRAGGAGLAARGRFRFLAAEHGYFEDDTVSYLRSLSLGLGVRAMRGPWGLELFHHRVTGDGLTAVSVLREEWPYVADPSDESASLVGAMLLRELGPDTRSLRPFVAIGGGFAGLAEDDLSALDDLFHSPVETVQIGDDVFEGSLRAVDHRSRSDRRVPLIGASFGVSVRRGHFLARLRLDGFFGWTRHAEGRWARAFVATDGSEFPGVDLVFPEVGIDTEIRPRFFLLSVDLGWSSRR